MVVIRSYINGMCFEQVTMYSVFKKKQFKKTKAAANNAAAAATCACIIQILN